MAAEPLTEEQVVPWVEKSLEQQDIKDYKISLSGRSEKGEGYATEVVFVTVTGIKKSNESKIERYFALKVSRILVDELKHFQALYKREAYVYNHIFPLYKEFQESKQVKVFKSIPKCVATLETDGRDIIVLENLRKEGYVPHDRMSPMNINHMKLILRNYAKFHAIGFAFKDQQKETFQNLTKDYYNPFIVMDEFKGMCYQRMEKFRDNIKEKDAELSRKIHGLIEDDIMERLKKVYGEIIEESTITHGDCWNSNFLFKYDGENKENPSEVAILDWQLSSLLSPATDLAYFMFIVSSVEQVAQFDNLLQFYHDHLSQYIRELGSDPDLLYPYSKFREHWKKFTFIGLVFAFAILEFILVETKDVKEFSDYKDLAEMRNAFLNVKPKNYDMYVRRMTSVCKYYFDLIDN